MSPSRSAYPSTHPSLLAGVADAHRQAWATFFVRYDGVIRRWCRRYRLNRHAIDDISQTVMADMPRKLRTYSRVAADGTVHPFRAWLRAVIRNQVIDSYRDARRQGGPLPDNVPAAELEAELASSHAADVRAVVAVVTAAVRPDTWAVYEQAHLIGRSAKDVAAEHGKSVGAVYVAVHRVNELLRTGYQARLRTGLGPDEESPDDAVPAPTRP